MPRKIIHVAKIDALIPEAEKIANEKLEEHIRSGGVAIETRDGATWCKRTEFFHQAMKELTREAGLRTI